MLSTDFVGKEGTIVEDGNIIRWKEIFGFPNYVILDDGRVWSRVVYKKTDGRFLKGRPSKDYLRVVLYYNGLEFGVTIHRLVAKNFVEGYEEGLTVNHKDCNKRNNHYSNLEWVTQKENVAHANKNGLIKNRKAGEDHPFAKIKKEDVREIRRLHATGLYTHKQIAIMYGKDRSSVSDIINRTMWKHVD